MAEVIASPLVELLIKKLGSVIWSELELLWDVNNDIEKLRRLLTTINNVLNDAERRSINNSALRNWLQDLKDATLHADDVVDEFHTEALWRRIKGHNRVMGKARDFLSPNNPIAFRYKMGHKIKDVRKRFNEIVQVQRDFHLIEGSSSSERVHERETYSFVNESEVYGRNTDKEKVIEFLVDMDNDKDVSVLPIVGLGGVGKTTLAQSVYNDESIKNHFELQMWICVAEDFDVKHITKGILECAMKEEYRLSDIENIQQCLRRKLRDKKFLLVLDDVWNENAGEWERLKPLLGGGKLGNKIIVTTRLDTVARIMGTVATPHRLDVLSHDDCWTLFKQRAFGLGREEENPKLAKIGKEIVRKCGGLPLAAKALGSLMGTKRGEVEWLAIKDSEIWRLPGGNDGIMPALRVSYDNLPPHLKQIFAYCSVFPKDYEIDRLKLIQLWIAEGLIRSSEEEMHAEDIGNEYFNSLLWRSFFQNEVRDNFGNIESCKMHDLVHGLACSVVRDEYCIIGAGIKGSVPHGYRYCSVICEDGLSSPILKVACEAKKLRSLILFVKYVSMDTEKFIRDAMSNLIRLRVLDLSGTGIRKFPNTVGKLKHLRLLDLSGTSINALPDSIAGLYNLQILNLRLCIVLRDLPKGMRNMSNLRHLDIFGCLRLTKMPHGLGRLSNLQTLPLFIVGEEPGRTIVELQNLNLIRGSLEIKGLNNVKDPMEAMKAKLWAKAKLQSLELSGLGYVRDNEDAEDILDKLKPPSTLRYLTINNYNGKRFPNWLTKRDPSSSFPHLFELKLNTLRRCGSLPRIGQFPSLKRLLFCDLPKLKEWFVAERDTFPSLQSLEISLCPKLTVQPCLPSSIVELSIKNSNEELLAAGGSLQGLSRLKELVINNIKASKSGWEGMQYLTALEELNISYCEELICLPKGIMHQHFASLRTMQLYKNLNLRSLGEGGKEPPLLFTALHHLKISQCHALTALPEWVGGLTSLQSLNLEDCRNLKMLPDALRRLTGLHRLTIVKCPMLKRRCEREKGEDWLKIAHIPYVDILINI